MQAAPDEDASLLTGDWRLFQKRRGHRWSLDDLVTAWFAAREVAAPPPTHLDLGCGLGSVLLMLAWRFPHATHLGVEAQAVSAALARKSIAWNGVEARVALREGDFRDEPFTPTWALVTGTPPYFPEGTGTESQKVQAAPCRFEKRGGVEAYLGAAARALSPEGRLVLCASVLQRARMLKAFPAEGLRLERHLEVIPKAGKAPLIGLFSFVRGAGEGPALPPLTVRDLGGAWTPEFRAVREAMGMPSTPP